MLLIELHVFDRAELHHPALQKLRSMSYHFRFLGTPGVQAHILAAPPEFGTDDEGDDPDAHGLWSSLIPGAQRNYLSWRRLAEPYGSAITE